MLLAVNDISARGGVVIRLHQHPLDLILHLLNIQRFMTQQACQHQFRQRTGLSVNKLATGDASRDKSTLNFDQLKGYKATITLA